MIASRLMLPVLMLLPGLHPASSVQEIPGADHYFNDAGDELVTAVAAWLDTLTGTAEYFPLLRAE